MSQLYAQPDTGSNTQGEVFFEEYDDGNTMMNHRDSNNSETGDAFGGEDPLRHFVDNFDKLKVFSQYEKRSNSSKSSIQDETANLKNYFLVQLIGDDNQK